MEKETVNLNKNKKIGYKKTPNNHLTLAPSPQVNVK